MCGSAVAVFEAAPFKGSAWAARANREVERWRRRALADQRLVSKGLVKELSAAHRRMIAEVGRAYAKGAPSSAGLAKLQGALRSIAADHAAALRGMVEKGIITSVDAAAAREAQVAALSYVKLLPRGVRTVMGDPLGATKLGTFVKQTLITRARQGPMDLSKRLWVIDQYTQDRVAAIARIGIERGLTVEQVAAMLRREVVPAVPTPGRPFGVGAGKAVDGVGRLRRTGSTAYQYTRLARDQMGRAARAAVTSRTYFLQKLPQPLRPVMGVKWNLSAGHRQQDVCDDWAAADSGLGEGVYEPQAVPIGHVQDLCYTSTAVVDLTSYGRGLESWLDRAGPGEMQAAIDAMVRESLSDRAAAAIARFGR